jgi:hypothetical protein
VTFVFPPLVLFILAAIISVAHHAQRGVLPVVLLISFALGAGAISHKKRSPERRLLLLLAEMFPSMSKESAGARLPAQ